MRFSCALLSLAIITSWVVRAGVAPAQTQASDEEEIPLSGRLREKRDTDTIAAHAADVLLFLPRQTVDLLFYTTSATAGILDDEQVVPRLHETFFTARNEIGVFPTAFAETGLNPNIGLRMISSVGRFGATIRAGYGGPDALVVDNRMRWTPSSTVPLVLGSEWFYDRRTDLSYPGLGPDPTNDPRNTFRHDSLRVPAAYRESRERWIVSAGLRLNASWELLASTSYKSRFVDAAPGSSAPIDLVFVPDSLPGLEGRSRVTYTELASRMDTRESRGGPSEGTLVETYSGIYQEVDGKGFQGVGSGVRAAWFIPIVRVTNIIAPRIAIDTVFPLSSAPMTFGDYLTPSDFRGFDSRRDHVTIVGSLDYRWTLMRFVSALLFQDVATVAPNLHSVSLNELHLASGFGLELHSSKTSLGRIAGAYSEGDYRIMLSIGVAPSGFGDRQHR